MTLPRLIQILPERPRTHEGVGDYAQILAERFREAGAFETSFVSCTALPPDARRRDAWETIELAARGKPELLRALKSLEAAYGPAPILLHLSGYGFQRWGAPFWLAAALREWRRHAPGARVVVVFHELFAEGPFPGKAFWLGLLHRSAVRAVQHACHGGLVTHERNLDWLKAAERPGQSFVLSPCFSTIGEPDLVLSAATCRPPRLVIFGRPNVLDRIYRDPLGLLTQFVEANAVEEIVDIGPRQAPPPTRIANASVRSLGALEAGPLRAELAGARFGILRYDADQLPKSSIFAAYAAHGAIPVCLSDQQGTPNGLQPGLNYLGLAESRAIPRPAGAEIDQLQKMAMAWYGGHSIQSTADRLSALLA